MTRKVGLPAKVTFGQRRRPKQNTPSWNPGVVTKTVRRIHHGGERIEVPVAIITGNKPGPTFAVTAGMHGGEYTGVLAAQKLIQAVKPKMLKGRLIVVPVISTQAFMMRSMQLSPVDEREVHYLRPGNPKGTYSECLIDLLYSIVKDANYLIDMHAGEFAQGLCPWVSAPMIGSKRMREDSRAIAEGFRVPYLELRTTRKRMPDYVEYLCEKGITNVWTEIGGNGLAPAEHVATQYDGAIAALQTFGMLPGKPPRPTHEWIGEKRAFIVAEQSGVWHSAVREGDIVEKGQVLGELKDYFGNTLKRYRAPIRGIVLLYWSSPAINHRRRPNGYNWHSGLVMVDSLVEDS
jgi:uncharacterized protein